MSWFFTVTFPSIIGLNESEAMEELMESVMSNPSSALTCVLMPSLKATPFKIRFVLVYSIPSVSIFLNINPAPSRSEFISFIFPTGVRVCRKVSISF